MEDNWDYLKGLLESDAERQANRRWVTCRAPGCLALVPGMPQLALQLCACSLNPSCRVSDTPRSVSRIAHIAWTVRVCTEHLRSGDIQDDLHGATRLCCKCHRLHPLAEFEVRLRHWTRCSLSC